MEKTWRWFGKNDAITLPMLKQIGVEGIVSSLHDVECGEVWNLNAIEEYNQFITSNGLKWSVVESLPVHEAIKYAGKERDSLIEKYKISLANLGKCGIKTVCYNFMPVIDWVRTDLNKKMENGTETLYFDKVRFAYFDCKILKRENAVSDYTELELQQVEELEKTISKSEKAELVDSIVIKTQKFVSRDIAENGQNPVDAFKNELRKFDGIGKQDLRENLKYFLEKVLPVAEEYGIGMCVHPDDPPFPIFGLPRIVTNEEDIEWILNSVQSTSNGLTFCAGSLSAGKHNNVLELAKKFAKRTFFAHLRSTEVLENGNFMEASHLSGRVDLVEVIRVFEKENPNIPMRIDHGKLMLDDKDKNYNPGYSFLGRMFALAQVEGMMAVVKNEIVKNKAL